jgi:hypothetical protein
MKGLFLRRILLALAPLLINEVIKRLRRGR